MTSSIDSSEKGGNGANSATHDCSRSETLSRSTSLVEVDSFAVLWRCLYGKQSLQAVIDGDVIDGDVADGDVIAQGYTYVVDAQISQERHNMVVSDKARVIARPYSIKTRADCLSVPLSSALSWCVQI